MRQSSPSKQSVTVLFTDLVGSTELAVELGASRGEALLREHLDTLSELVEQSGGRVVKLLGDGVMASFASASAAIDCAVAMQQTVARATRRRGRRLAIRVGVAAGDVIVDDDLFGRPVVEAARLCSAARGGQILATDIAARLGADAPAQR